MHRTSLIRCFMAALAGLTPLAHLHAAAPDSGLDEIVVTATLRATPLEELPGSVTVLGGNALHAAGQQHFEEVIAQVPNLTWAGDTSRPRYFQIRGVGELQQYQGAPNPSVGFLIDDIDFSGLGSAATLFDVDQVEVLHGPQGTLYGANALAGLIYVKSAAPASVFGARAEFDAGNYGERSYGGVITGPVDALDSSFRLAVQKTSSDGFYHDVYLNRHDTDARDELTVRARWRYEPNAAWQVDFTALRVQMDNNYDAFSIDNSRTTQSDHPGVDVQNSTGLSAHATYTGLAPVTLSAIATYADSVIRYGFDGDWGNPNLWAPYTYDYTDLQLRRRSTRSLELRAASAPSHGLSWTVGLYGLELRENLSDTSLGVYADPADPDSDSATQDVIFSRYRARNVALYGELDGEFTPRLRWSVGLRGERRTTAYSDVTTSIDTDPVANRFTPADNLWGGHASLDYRLDDAQHLYALIARGYKAGGFNLSQGLPAAQRQFNPESDVNFEVGHKLLALGGALRLDSSLFYMQRHHEQLLTGEQLDPSDPNTFIYFSGNAASGFNYGLESSLAWTATRALELGASLGLLQTRYHGFVQNDVTLPDRALPHAPSWQAAVNATWRDSRGAYLRLDVTGMGAFLYDLPPNDTRSNAYGLVHGRIGWSWPHYEVYLWGRNLLDKRYTVRGFFFGDEPPDFDNKLYTQLGEPRNVGVHFTAKY
jgi:iron complex outermembrane recepter protein